MFLMRKLSKMVITVNIVSEMHSDANIATRETEAPTGVLNKIYLHNTL